MPTLERAGGHWSLHGRGSGKSTGHVVNEGKGGGQGRGEGKMATLPQKKEGGKKDLIINVSKKKRIKQKKRKGEIFVSSY